jgi:hypothetical protein
VKMRQGRFTDSPDTENMFRQLRGLPQARTIPQEESA